VTRGSCVFRRQSPFQTFTKDFRYDFSSAAFCADGLKTFVPANGSIVTKPCFDCKCRSWRRVDDVLTSLPAEKLQDVEQFPPTLFGASINLLKSPSSWYVKTRIQRAIHSLLYFHFCEKLDHRRVISKEARQWTICMRQTTRQPASDAVCGPTSRWHSQTARTCRRDAFSRFRNIKEAL
jgi:hypothetical protein